MPAEIPICIQRGVVVELDVVSLGWGAWYWFDIGVSCFFSDKSREMVNWNKGFSSWIGNTFVWSYRARMLFSVQN